MTGVLIIPWFDEMPTTECLPKPGGRIDILRHNSHGSCKRQTATRWFWRFRWQSLRWTQVIGFIYINNNSREHSTYPTKNRPKSTRKHTSADKKNKKREKPPPVAGQHPKARKSAVVPGPATLHCSRFVLRGYLETSLKPPSWASVMHHAMPCWRCLVLSDDSVWCVFDLWYLWRSF